MLIFAFKEGWYIHQIKNKTSYVDSLETSPDPSKLLQIPRNFKFLKTTQNPSKLLEIPRNYSRSLETSPNPSKLILQRNAWVKKKYIRPKSFTPNKYLFLGLSKKYHFYSICYIEDNLNLTPILWKRFLKVIEPLFFRNNNKIEKYG